MTWSIPERREEEWQFVKCGWRRSKLSNAKSIAKTLEKNVVAQILLPIYHSLERFFVGHIHQGCHSNERMKFLDFSLIFWPVFKFPDFSGQYSNSFTFPGFPGSVTTLIHGFTVMEHWAYFGSNPKTQSISKILRHRKSYSLI